MKIKSSLLMLLLLVSLIGCGTPVSSFTTTTAKVLKVYSTTDTVGHSFIAYVVNHNGVEVVVSDALARTSYTVGDTIEFMDHKMQMSGGQYKTLSFSILK